MGSGNIFEDLIEFGIFLLSVQGRDLPSLQEYPPLRLWRFPARENIGRIAIKKRRAKRKMQALVIRHSNARSFE